MKRFNRKKDISPKYLLAVSVNSMYSSYCNVYNKTGNDERYTQHNRKLYYSDAAWC